MKRKIPQKFYLFVILGFLAMFFMPNFSGVAQENFGCPVNIALPEEIGTKLKGDYDAQPSAYGTEFLGHYGDGGSLEHPKPWDWKEWRNCLNSGQNIGNPPLPESNKNGVFFQITAGDFIEVNKLEVRNNVTLVVCGYLHVTSLEDPAVQYNNVRIFVCPGGVLRAKELDLKNNIEIFNYGTMQVDVISHSGGSGNNHCITGNGIFQTYSGDPHSTTIIEDDGTWYYNLDNLQGSGWTFGDGCTTPGILPIELLSFTPQVKPDQIELNWTTGTEINNDFFTLERSRDLFGWEILGYETGAGNSSTPINYSFSDLTPLDGLAYYRLKQTDFDGKFKYYGPIAAHYDLGMEGLEFKVMKQFTKWVIVVPNDGIYQVELYNLSGQRLISEKVSNTLSVPAPDGAVVIRVTDGLARSVSRVVM